MKVSEQPGTASKVDQLVTFVDEWADHLTAAARPPATHVFGALVAELTA